MKSKVVFRVDGSAKIGLGHLIRCIALADIIRNYFEINFYCKEIPNSIKQELTKKNILLFQISNEEDFIEIIKLNWIIVLDGYKFNQIYKSKVKRKGCKLISICDFVEEDIFSDIIINHNPIFNVIKYPYKINKNQILAIGSGYSLLRKPFIQQSYINKKKSLDNSLMICLGGSDKQDITLDSLRKIVKINSLKKISVVLGSEYKKSEEFNKIVKSDKRIFLYNNILEELLVKIILESKIAIVSASTILLEVISCGTIPIICYYVNNQKLFHDFMVSNYNLCSFSEKGIFDFNKLEQIILNNLYEKIDITPLQQIISKSENNLISLFNHL